MLTVTVEDLLDELAQGTPVAAAGSAAALVTATAAAVAAVAARASLDSWDEARASAAQADALRGRAVALAAEDTEAVEAVIAVQELEQRRSGRAARLPSRPNARASGRRPALDRRDRVATSRSWRRTSQPGAAATFARDAVAAAYLAHGAARAAAHLVEINLAAGGDSVRVKRCRDLVRAAAAAADEASVL